MIRTLDAQALGLEAVVTALARPPERASAEIHATVDTIVAAVRERGDDALVELTARFDRFEAGAPAALAIGREELAAAERDLDGDVRAALHYAAGRIARYHEASRPTAWRLTDEHGSVLGQDVRPLDRVGIYVPGGRAAYPSTVLMTAIPARVAGVRDIVLVTPPNAEGRVMPTVLAAAHVAGVTEAWRVGGAQAIAALAYGTKSIRRVDKIVGPGNIYVALAKRRVFGDVGIDMVAGPSEIVVVADASARADWIAADLLAQAEHDPMARAVLVTDAAALIAATRAAVDRRLATLPRRAIAAQALAEHGALVLVPDLGEAVELANRLAPEHLELYVREPETWLPRVRHAGAVFLGGRRRKWSATTSPGRTMCCRRVAPRASRRRSAPRTS